jgi:dTDP-4-amino-4,6-dideoxygalactose transaminase
VINDEKVFHRAEIVWEKGTNRSAFIRGEVDKYGWVDIGSSFLPSELTAAFLCAQLENIEFIQQQRHSIWNYYNENLPEVVSPYGATLPEVPPFAQHNAHIFYLICDSAEQREFLTASLKKAGIQAFFHYPPLHFSKYHLQTHKPVALPNALKFSEQLIRLPLYVGLKRDEQDYIIAQVGLALAAFSKKK